MESGKNQFQIEQEQSDLEALKNFVPSWETADIEPFIHDVPVIPPTWNKVKLDQDFETNTGGTTSVSPGTTKVICAVQQGSTYVPKLMTPVNGTLFEDP